MLSKGQNTVFNLIILSANMIFFFLMRLLRTSFVTVSVMQTDSWRGCLKERAVQSHHRKTNPIFE